ncbi:MAG: DUF4149 domain-containing protein [Verrucomicrobiae bacterium]|nr:DUF4149 domain-containing protein [Verrucomicrobiae bacterium]
MIQFLRLIGIFNGAVWLGSAVFFTLSIGPAVFSPQMLAIFPPDYPEEARRYYVGLVAQVLISSYFKAGLWCAAIAIFHMVAEWLYTGRTPRAWRVYLLVFLLAGGLVGRLYMQPNMETLHRAKYSRAPRPRAARRRRPPSRRGMRCRSRSTC